MTVKRAKKTKKVERDEALDSTKLPSGIEADIASVWADNFVAAQMTRTVARALLRQNRTEDEIREHIRSAGRVVD